MMKHYCFRRRGVPVFLAVLLVMGLLCLSSGLVQAQTDDPPPLPYSLYLPVISTAGEIDPRPEFAPGVLVVQLQPQLNSDDATVLASAYSADVVDVIPEVGGYVRQQ